MNAPTDHLALRSEDHRAALDEAFHWRGECIQHYAELEVTLCSLLHFLSATAKGSKVKTGQPIRPSFDELKRVTGPKGSFAKQGRSIAASLGVLERHIDWRAHLTHGILDVWRGRKGQWLLTLRHRATGITGTERLHAITRDDANAMRTALAAEIGKFQQRARALETSLGSPT